MKQIEAWQCDDGYIVKTKREALEHDAWIKLSAHPALHPAVVVIVENAEIVFEALHSYVSDLKQSRLPKIAHVQDAPHVHGFFEVMPKT